MLKIYQNRAKCIGCNACVEADRNRWRISRKDGKSTLVGATEIKGIYRTEVELDEYDAVMNAIKNCPVKIIEVVRVR